MHGFEPGNRDVRVALRTGDLAVAQDLLHMADVGTVVEHGRGHRVAEQVAGAALGNAGLLEVVAHAPAQPVRRQRMSVLVQEQVPLCGIAQQHRPRHAFVLRHPGQRPLTDGRKPIFLALAQPHVQRAAGSIKVGLVQVRQLGAADASGVEQLQAGAITQAFGLLDVGQGQDGFHFLQRQRLAQVVGAPGQFQVGGRIRGDDLVPHQPAEEHFQREQRDPLAVHCDRLPVRLAVHEQVPLEPRQVRMRDRIELLDAALVAPAVEVRQAATACFLVSQAALGGLQMLQIAPYPRRQAVGIARCQQLR